jgi:hypothetical protein
LVTKKNRKVRRLRELYPDVRCKVFYERDYLNLLVKYGLEEPAQKKLVRTPHPRKRPAPQTAPAPVSEGPATEADGGGDAEADASAR